MKNSRSEVMIDDSLCGRTWNRAPNSRFVRYPTTSSVASVASSSSGL
jgi:hypothetical protein